MKRTVSLVIVLAVLFILCQYLGGCAGDERQAVPTETRPGQEQLVRLVPEKSHDSIVQRALADPDVRAAEEFFCASGLRKAPAWTVSITGEGSEGKRITITILGYTSPDSLTAGLIAYIQDDTRIRVRPCVVQRKPTGVFPMDGSIELAEYEVTRERTLMPIADGSPDSTGGPGTFNWRKFWRCVGMGTVSTMVWCAGKCVPTGIAYGECFLGCLGMGEVLTIFTCAIAELAGGE